MNGRDQMLAAWDRFPGRNCSEQQWNSWMNTMLRAVEAARKEVSEIPDYKVTARRETKE